MPAVVDKIRQAGHFPQEFQQVDFIGRSGIGGAAQGRRVLEIELLGIQPGHLHQTPTQCIQAKDLGLQLADPTGKDINLGLGLSAGRFQISRAPP